MIKIYPYGQVSAEELFARGTAAADVSDKVAEIIAQVCQKGDAALIAYAEHPLHLAAKDQFFHWIDTRVAGDYEY